MAQDSRESGRTAEDRRRARTIVFFVIFLVAAAIAAGVLYSLPSTEGGSPIPFAVSPTPTPVSSP